MKLVISSIFFLFSLNVFSCEIQKLNSEVISLSSVVTYIFKDLKLLSQVKAVSSFHGLNQQDFSGELLQGGVFISNQYWKKFNNPLIFFDESKDLKNKFKNKNLSSVEVISRGLDPFEVNKLGIELVKPFLSGCEKGYAQLNATEESVKKNLSKLPNFSDKVIYVFYLGEISKFKRQPNLVMIDSFILWLKKNKNLKTYPSEKNYISWSSLVMNKLEKEGRVVSIGLNMSTKNEDNLEIKKITDDSYNFYHPKLLLPGLPSILLLPRLSKALQDL